MGVKSKFRSEYVEDVIAETVSMMVVISVIAFALGLIYFILLPKFTSVMFGIEVTTFTLSFFALSGVSFYLDVLAIAMPSLFLGLIYTMRYHQFRLEMPLYTIMFEMARGMISKYDSIPTVALGGLIGELLLVVFWVMTSIYTIIILSHEKSCRSERQDDRVEAYNLDV
jgi:hypothetical protein